MSDGGAASHNILAGASVTASFTVQYYLMTAASPAAGGTILQPSGWYNAGMSFWLTAQANPGYQFSYFGIGNSYSSNYEWGATYPVSVTAYFVSTVQTIASSPAGASLTVDGVSCTAPCSFQWASGTQHTIGATATQYPASGTEVVFSGWSDGGGISHSITASAGTSYTAYFNTLYFLTTAVNIAADGTVAPASGWYNSGWDVQVNASPAAGYVLTGFSGGLTGTTNPQDVTMNGPVSVTVNFARPVTVATQAPPATLSVPNNNQRVTGSYRSTNGDPTGLYGNCSTWDPNVYAWINWAQGGQFQFWANSLANLGSSPVGFGETCQCLSDWGTDDWCLVYGAPVDVQATPNVTMLVNNTADTSDDITTLNPVQTIPIQITVNGANLTAVALSVTPAGSASLDQYTLNLTNHQPVTVTLTPQAASHSPHDVQITAVWPNSGNPIEVAQASLTIVGVAVSRQSLTQFTATGSPQGGTFSYVAGYLSGNSSFSGEPQIQFSSGITAQTNPNLAVLSSPANPCAKQVPCAGILSAIDGYYGISTNQFLLPTSASAQFNVATFGLSRYYTTSQQQWGTAPDSCVSTTITVNGNPVTYSGAAPTSPAGLPTGNYCNAFLAQLRLQGSASLTDGALVQYDPNNGYGVVSVITGADGSPVQVGQTIARDRSIIPMGGVLVDINGIGNGLLANDTGGQIQGYRIDYYNGIGPNACSGFNNIMAVSGCNPGYTTCPASTAVGQ